MPTLKSDDLGVAVRTVAKWEARGAKILPLPTMQEALDTVLQQATPEQQARFDVLRRECQPDPAIPLGSHFGEWASRAAKQPADIDVRDGDEAQDRVGTVGSEEEDTAGNVALRRLLGEAGLTHASLAKAVVAAGAEEGLSLGTNTRSVKRMLEGCQPRSPVPKLVAKVLTRHLGHEIGVTDCGFVDHSPVSDDLLDGLNCTRSVDDTALTLVRLSTQDLKQRRFLLGSPFAAAAFSEAALFALALPSSARSTARGSGRRVGSADVEIFTEHIAHLRRLDHHYGAGRIRWEVVELLHRVTNGTYTEKTGKAPLAAIAQAACLAGSTAADVGRYSLAQRYFIQALNLAVSADDRSYAADVLATMSRLTIHMGHCAASERDKIHHARQAVALARAGLSMSHGHTTAAVAALLNAVEARGQALLGDANATRQAVLEAERLYERSRPDEEPPWLSFYTAAELAADLGRCLRDIGESEPAAELIQWAMDRYESWRVRSRCFVQTDLATVHLVGRELERAAAVGHDALSTAADIRSARIVDRIRTLQRQIEPLRSGSIPLAELDEQITDFLTLQSGRQSQDRSL